MNESVRLGGCLCGAVRFALRGDPVRTNICHCLQCRRQAGAAAAAFATYPAEPISLETGTPAAYRASAKVTRSFCAQCGSTLFWGGDEYDEVSVFLGTLDEAETVRPPDYELFCARRLPWLPAVPGSEQYDADRFA
jgi:hypothetical protein